MTDYTKLKDDDLARVVRAGAELLHGRLIYAAQETDARGRRPLALSATELALYDVLYQLRAADEFDVRDECDVICALHVAD